MSRNANNDDGRGAGRVGQVKEVTSLANPVIKDIRALTQKKARDESGTFIAEGLKLVMRHRLVYDAVHDMINKAEIHALAINAIAPSELS